MATATLILVVVTLCAVVALFCSMVVACLLLYRIYTEGKRPTVGVEPAGEAPQYDTILDNISQPSVSSERSEEELLADLNDWERALWAKQQQAHEVNYPGQHQRLTPYLRAQLRRASLRRGA
jgi:hypothetical protein